MCPSNKANKFLNKSATENPLHKELIRNKEVLKVSTLKDIVHEMIHSSKKYKAFNNIPLSGKPLLVLYSLLQPIVRTSIMLRAYSCIEKQNETPYTNKT